MKSALVLLFALAACSAQLPVEDDGSWKPHLDGSALGNGDLLWLGPDSDDGQYRPQLYEQAQRRRRSVAVVDANTLAVPADTLEVASAKAAQLIQQNTEGTRNILGGGIPLALPADTPEVAAGKQAHAIAHENQKAATLPLAAFPALAPISIAARLATPLTAHLATPLVAPVASPLVYSAIHPIAGLHGLW